MKEFIYLDHAATTPMHPSVIDKMTEAMQNAYGNASSVHQLGRRSKGLLEEARQVFASSINAHPTEIVMTSGGTESDNMAILKTAETCAAQGKHVITTSIEHPAVKEPISELEARGFEITVLPVNQEGRISVQQVIEALRPDTILVSVIYGNNEIGSLMPITEIGQYLKTLDHQVIFHTDAVQAYGTEVIDVKEQGIDLLSVSSHKINGPKGVGFLYVNRKLSLPAMMTGGEQESRRRAGTENIPGILGFQEAVKIRMQEKNNVRAAYQDLKDNFLKEMDNSSIEYAVNGSLDHSLPHILSVHIKGVQAEKLLIHLDLAHVAVSTGSACSAGNVDPSPVLEALHGQGHPAVAETLRFSFGYGLTREQVVSVVLILEKAVAFLKEK
ncbi:Cysteine desulfurase [Alkalibacterium sp. AK22]|uniref:cysteine desulfurase family protein n=1 Tax=Alkalibacterium sp. AK22 TaxID=1229520 RepID=UPI00044BE347|nr:cysteine desulfurase family protein [Alkalibacterium sp. AK22]EXJ22813.1 Cysteine desulfurase [Alkalibacterium sp. AK22]